MLALLGLSGDIGIGIGTGAVGFFSLTDPTINGAEWYVAVSASADVVELIDAGIGLYLGYDPFPDRPDTYLLPDGTVDKGSLAVDILFHRDDVSPWLIALPSYATASRVGAAVLGAYYAYTYEEIHGLSQ